MIAMTDDSVMLEEIFELDAANQIGTLLSRVREERLRRGRVVLDPSRVSRTKPLDPRDMMIAELEQFGLNLRIINALENFLCSQPAAAARDRVDCLTVGYLCLFAATELGGIGSVGTNAVRDLRLALYRAGQSYRPAKRIFLRGDRDWRPPLFALGSS